MSNELVHEAFLEMFRDSAVEELRRRDAEEEREYQEGIREAREETLTLLLRERFGDQDGIQAAAQRLTGWSDSIASVHAGWVANDLDALAKMMDVAEQGCPACGQKQRLEPQVQHG